MTLLNEPFFVGCAHALGRRTVEETAGTTAERIRYAFMLCMGRTPTADELTELTNLFSDLQKVYASDPESAKKLLGEGKPGGTPAPATAAWVVLARTILNLDELITRE